jgi:hypothetical protein
VAQAIHETRTMDQVYPLNDAAFFDELFQYIREIGAWALLEDLDPKSREGALYPFIQFVLFTMMRCVGGVQSMLATREVLLMDEALMGVVGFNAAQVREGSNDRGLSRRTQPVEIRGHKGARGSFVPSACARSVPASPRCRPKRAWDFGAAWWVTPWTSLRWRQRRPMVARANEVMRCSRS